MVGGEPLGSRVCVFDAGNAKLEWYHARFKQFRWIFCRRLRLGCEILSFKTGFYSGSREAKIWDLGSRPLSLTYWLPSVCTVFASPGRPRSALY